MGGGQYGQPSPTGPRYIEYIAAKLKYMPRRMKGLKGWFNYFGLSTLSKNDFCNANILILTDIT